MGLVLLVASAFFMEFLDGTIIVTALPAMARSLGTEAVTLHVGITAYLLTVAVFILPGGWLADRIGTRTVFVAAISTFTLGSVLCGLANAPLAFVAARTVQGLGGAMMVPVGRLVVLRTTPKQGLMRAVALLTWPALSAPLLGPPLGGFIVQHFSWRWIFLLNLPLGLAGGMLALWLVPQIRTRRASFDWGGFLIGAALLLCTMLALDAVGAGTAPPAEIAALAAGGAVAAVLLLRHVRRRPDPLLDPAPFAVPTFRIVMTTGTVQRVLISTMPFLLPLFFQLGFGLDPFRAGLLVLALFAGNLGIKPLTSPLLRRFGFRAIIVANAVLQAATMLACAFLTPSVPTAVIVAVMVLSGASRSLQFTAHNTLAFADVPQPWMGGANTLFSVSFQLGIGFGVAVGAAILRSAGIVLGDAAVPSLAAFHATFVAMAALMVLTSVWSLRLADDAGAIVSGHAPRRPSPAPGG